MIRKLVHISVHFVFWVAGLMVINGFWVPFVDKYATAGKIDWIFSMYLAWSTAWVIVSCVVSYHLTLKTLHCRHYEHEGCGARRER